MTDTNKCNEICNVTHKEHRWITAQPIIHDNVRICFDCFDRQVQNTDWIRYTSEEM